MTKIVLAATTDICYDQRMIRISTSLANAGYDTTLVGRKRPSSIALKDRPFRQHRFNIWFDKGKLFYLEYNFRLFWYLLFVPCDIICGIDLDALLPSYWVAKLRGKVFVHDQHEYFTELEEVVKRPMVKRVWKWVESYVLPRAKYGYTINQTYRGLFQQDYGVALEVIRNVSVLDPTPLPERKASKYVLYQGAVNHGRGIPMLIKAMHQVDCQLVICGLGDIYEAMQDLVVQEGLSEKVQFKGYVQPEELRGITREATIGTTLFEKAGKSNYYSLANRFFDYLHGGVPQVCMNYPEYRSVNAEFEIGILIDELNEHTIAAAINELLNDPAKYERMRANCIKARQVINWQEEEKKLLALYAKIVTESGLEGK